MELGATGFDWDRGNTAKCRGHGVAIETIEAIFHRLVWVVPDPAHSTGEQRYRAIGTDDAGRHVFVAFTLRHHSGGALIRPISARYMHEREIRHYEKQKAEAEKTSGPRQR